MGLERYSKQILRISMSLVFLYFGIQQIISLDYWIGFVPDFFISLGFEPETLIIINGVLEISLGGLLILGLFTRISAFILMLNLFGIAFSIGFNPLGMRDFGLAIAMGVVALNGIDDWCLDRKRIHVPLVDKDS